MWLRTTHFVSGSQMGRYFGCFAAGWLFVPCSSPDLLYDRGPPKNASLGPTSSS